MKKMKGQLYVLESAIGILIILSILLLFFRTPRIPEFKSINYKLKAYEALQIMKVNGDLRRDAIDANVTSIKSKLSPYLPSFLNYSLTVFDQNGNLTPIPSSLNKKDMVCVSYLLAGNFDEYSPRIVKVCLWGFS